MKPRRINHANPRENRCDVRRCRHNRSQQRDSSRSLVRLPPSLRLLSSPSLWLLSSPALLASLVLARSSQGIKAGNVSFVGSHSAPVYRRGPFYLRKSSGNFKMFAAIRRASSLPSSFAAKGPHHAACGRDTSSRECIGRNRNHNRSPLLRGKLPGPSAHRILVQMGATNKRWP
jgi:hypothetical protein